MGFATGIPTMLEIIFLIAGLYMLFVGKISLAGLYAQKGLIRFVGLCLLIILVIDRIVWGMYPIGLSAEDAQGTVNQILLVGFVAALFLIFVAFATGSSANASADMVTPSEAANYYLVSEQEVERMIQVGAIKTKRVRGRRCVSREAVGNYLKRTGTVNNFLPDLPGTNDEHS